MRCDSFVFQNLYHHLNFNPRTCVRCDADISAFSRYLFKFQSTHLREVRLGLTRCVQDPTLFQSTHLREVRLIHRLLFELLKLFQSTHLREVRLVTNTGNIGLIVFQSTHLREVRLLCILFLSPICFISIHAPA